jgi:hypothetical protein
MHALLVIRADKLSGCGVVIHGPQKLAGRISTKSNARMGNTRVGNRSACVRRDFRGFVQRYGEQTALAAQEQERRSDVVAQWVIRHLRSFQHENRACVSCCAR